MLTKRITCNGTRIYFDASAWIDRHPPVQISPDFGVECEMCGVEVDSQGVVDGDCLACGSCGQTYTAKDAELNLEYA